MKLDMRPAGLQGCAAQGGRNQCRSSRGGQAVGQGRQRGSPAAWQGRGWRRKRPADGERTAPCFFARMIPHDNSCALVVMQDAGVVDHGTNAKSRGGVLKAISDNRVVKALTFVRTARVDLHCPHALRLSQSRGGLESAPRPCL